MDATPYLYEIGAAFKRLELEAVMIGNGAAAIQGAPVTTVDLDFLFRATPRNIAKLKQFAKELQFVIYRPFYPSSKMFRLSRDLDRVQLDFCVKIGGVRSYESLRSKASTIKFGGQPLLIASLGDIIKSKAAAGRPQDLAVLPILETAYARIQEAKAQEKADSETRV